MGWLRNVLKDKREYERKDARDVIFSDEQCPVNGCVGKLVYYKLKIYQ